MHNKLKLTKLKPGLRPFTPSGQEMDWAAPDDHTGLQRKCQP